MKCYKVVRKKEGELVSCILSQHSTSWKLAKKYGTDFLTDHALVFEGLQEAKSFVSTAQYWGMLPYENFEVWEAKAAHLEPCEQLSDLTLESIKMFLKTGLPMRDMSVPYGTMFAFDLRLVRRKRSK